MAAQPQVAYSTREITVLAEDPSVLTGGGRPLLAKVRIPSEPLAPGPRGSRFEVIDYDASTGSFYKPYVLPQDCDPYQDAGDIEKLLADPGFHAQNVFGVAAATLFEFERALGRSLSWGFAGESHQLKLVPHAFEEANAFYSREDEALIFGYFKQRKTNIFTCLSHDIVAHETAHALLDGMRNQYTRPSSNQQGAFHEGFADVIALLSVLRSEKLIQFALRVDKLGSHPTGRIPLGKALERIQNKGFLFGLAEEMGKSTDPLGRDALRRSIRLVPDDKMISAETEVHALGEVLVAAVIKAFVEVWHARLSGKFKSLEKFDAGGLRNWDHIQVDLWRIAEEGAKAAQHLLTMVIRAVDYLPPVHVEFRDFLMAMLTSDMQTCPDDSTYHYRRLLIEAFKPWGIYPHPAKKGQEIGTYCPFDKDLRYSRGNSDSMHWDREGMFRFVWENRRHLGLVDDAYTKVSSVRSVSRVAPDGFIVRETIAEYYQLVKQADRGVLRHFRIPVPDFVADNLDIRFDLVGGGALIFDEFGQLKYHISNHLSSPRQKDRLIRLNFSGQLVRSAAPDRPFALAHLKRGGLTVQQPPAGMLL